MLFAAILSICALSSKTIAKSYVVPRLQGMIDLHPDLKCIFLSLILSFFMSSCLTLWRWKFYYFPQMHRVFAAWGNGTTIEILLTQLPNLVLIFMAAMGLLDLCTIAECAGGASSSNAGNPNVPPGRPDLNDLAPPLTDAELARDSEANAAECEKLVRKICQEEKKIAKAAGIRDKEILDNIEKSVKYLADVDQLEEEARISFLHQFKKNLKNHEHEIWFEIDRECKRWGGRGLW